MAKYVDVDKLWRKLPDDLPYKASVKRVLIQAPAADVVEVKRGHMIKVKDPVKEDVALDGACSVCGAINWDYTDGEYFNYCPNCGAKWIGD
jgi:hypothetical protein